MKLNPLVMLLLLLTASLAASAQVAAPPAAGIQADSPETWQGFDAGTDQEYLLGRGDVIQVDVIGRAELSGKHIVGPDGRVAIPFVGSLKLADRSREQAAADIKAALSKYYENLTVVVGVDLYNSNHVLVVGAVAKPGLIPFDQPPTLLEIISRAGGLPNQSAGVIQGKPVAIPERCAIFRGSKSVIWVDLRKLVESGSSLAMMHLRRDDVVFVPSAGERYVSMFGEVLHPGMLELEEGSTLTQLLAEAGGIVPDRAGRFPDIQVIQEGTGNIQVVPYKDILAGKAKLINLHSGDIVYVPESKFNRLAVTLTKISPLVSVGTVAGIIARP